MYRAYKSDEGLLHCSKCVQFAPDSIIEWYELPKWKRCCQCSNLIIPVGLSMTKWIKRLWCKYEKARCQAVIGRIRGWNREKWISFQKICGTGLIMILKGS